MGGRHVSVNLIDSALGRDHRALAGVGFYYGLGVLVEGDEPLLDGVNVVVSAAGGLRALEKSLCHCIVANLEVQDVLAGGDRLLELLSLGDFARVAVDKETLGAAEPLNHCLGQEVEHGGEGNQLATLHDGSQVLAALGAGGDLLPQQVAGGEVGEAVLGHDLVALGSLAAARAAQHPHDGQAGGLQCGAVNRHCDGMDCGWLLVSSPTSAAVLAYTATRRNLPRKACLSCEGCQ